MAATHDIDRVFRRELDGRIRRVPGAISDGVDASPDRAVVSWGAGAARITGHGGSGA